MILTRYGELCRPALNGLEYLGQIFTNGDFRLSNGHAGNLWQTGAIQLNPLESDHPFMMALRAAQRQRAMQNSEIPPIRQGLTRYGIDGRGIQVGILDPYEKRSRWEAGQPGKVGAERKKEPLPGGGAAPESTDDWVIPDHTRVAAMFVNDAVSGAAPGATVVDAGFVPTKIPAKNTDNLGDFTQYMQESIANHFRDLTRQINHLAANRPPSLRVLSLTWGHSRGEICSDVLNLVNVLKNGQYECPQIREAILGPARFGSDEEQVRAVYRYVDALCDSPQMKEAQAGYIEATRRAAQSGLFIAVAVGNGHEGWPSRVPLPPGAEMNEMAKSPYVIAVGGSNSNQTPGDTRDDGVTGFSSRGDGYTCNPTILAPSDELYINRPVGGIGINNVTGGTSFGTPFTAAGIALMLQRNPNLTFDELKYRLQSTATRLPGYTIAEQGAGVLNMVQAVMAA